jgi:hypothetical protein
MIDLPNDAWFIVAGYGVILGGLALYAGTLLRRLAAARRALDRSAGPATDRTDEDRG